MNKLIFLLLISFLTFTSFAQDYAELVKCVPTDRKSGVEAWFGDRVAIEGNWAVVGALLETTDETNNASSNLFYAGAAYIYFYNGIRWTQMQKIVPSNRAIFDQFGCSVDISGNYIVIGAEGKSAAYVFENIAGVWTETQILVPSDVASGDNFGHAVAIDETNIIVGAYQEDEDAFGGGTLNSAGSAYIFSLVSGGTWSQAAKLVASDRGADDQFGFSVDIEGDYAIVGAPLEDHNATGTATLSNAGSAYTFGFNTGSWQQQAKLVASDRSTISEYGFAVSIGGSKALVGAYHEDLDASGANFQSNAGAVYVNYRFGTSTWFEIQKIVASDRSNTSNFGASIDIDGSKVIIGASDEKFGNGGSLVNLAGSAYIFEEAPSTFWTEVQKVAAQGREVGDSFGVGVAMSDSNIVVGARYHKLDSNNLNSFSNAGAVYFFRPPPLPNQNIGGVINDYAAVPSLNVCNQEMTLDDATDFEIDDTVMIIQMKGATMNLSNTAGFGDLVSLNNAGNYEYNVIASKSGNIISFQNAWQHDYDVTGKVQIVSIPHYTGDIDVTGTLTADQWDGNKGGILIFNVAGQLNLKANIDVSGKGFRGGFNDQSLPRLNNTTEFTYFAHSLPVYAKYFYEVGTDSAAQKGEGIVEYLPRYDAGKGKNLNGGGGSNISKAGGGGGASRANGGNGGISDHIGASNLFNKSRGFNPGIGGQSVVDGTRLFLAGAGGPGHGNNADYYGGNGGGIVIVNAARVEGNTWSILANGQDGNNGIIGNGDGGSGGGAGGSVFVNSVVTNPATVIYIYANGGDGGDTNEGTDEYCHGPGGGGGGGEIRTSINTNLNTSVLGGVAGVVTNSTLGCNGSTKGATAGGNGAFVNVNGAGIILVNTPFMGVNDVVINTPPDTLEICEGGNTSVSIDTTGSITPVSFQWQLKNAGTWTDLTNAGIYSGINTDELTFTGVTAIMNNNFYRVLVYHPCDSAYSDSINLKVNLQAVINTQPQDTIVCIGNNGAFIADVSNIVSYNWQSSNGGPYSNLTNNATYSGVATDSLYITNVTAAMATINYRLRLVDECGLVTFTNVVNVIPTSLIDITFTSPNLTICEGTDTIMYVTTNFEGTTYAWQIDAGAGFQNITTPNPSISGTTNDTLNINNAHFSGMDLDFRLIASDACGTSDTSSIITLTVNPISNTTVNDTICSNEMYTLPSGSMTGTAGTYSDTLNNSNGCDSIVTTNLIVYNNTSSIVNDTICGNEMYTLPDGQMVNTTGVYMDTLVNSNNCDSVITTNLQVNSISTTAVNDTICSNEMYTLPNGQVVNTTGVYIDTLANSNNCDSIITTNLQVKPTSSSTVNDTICSNEMYTLPGGQMVNTTDVYTDTIPNSNGCDSVITTNLQVNPISNSTVVDTICGNEMYTLPDGQMVNTTGVYLDTLANSNNCDSIITTNLQVNPISTTVINDTICGNEMYTLPDGQMVNTTGVYIDTFANSNNCDSIVTTNLQVNPISTTTVNDTICSNEMYTLPDGQMVNTAGLYVDTLANSNNCDSIITTNLEVNPTSSSTVNDTICSNEMYTLPDGQMVNTTGVYIDTLANSNSCDSVITTNLQVNPISNSTVTDTICGNEMYTLPDGQMVNTTGVYIDTLANSNNCDSIITTNLQVNPISTTTLNDTICSNEMYTLPDGQMVNTTGVYIDTLINSNSCDSIITTNLQVNATSSSTVNDTICSNEMYTLPDGQMVNTTNVYIDTLANSNGCDSVITTNLQVNPTSSSTVVDTICSNEMYTLPDGQMVNTTDIYIDTLANSNGCDSVITTDLLVYPISNTNVADTICSNEMYTLPDGQMVNITGIYIDTLMNTNGCDSIITTNLLVNPTTSSTVNDSICVNATYTLPDGEIVNTAGTYLDTLTNSNSCDSVITTNLTVLPNVVINIMPADVTVCEDSSTLFYVNVSGTYLTYQWQANNGAGFVNIPGETNDTLNINNVTTPLDLSNTEYRVLVNSFCGNIITSDVAVLTIEFNVAITSNIVDAVVCENLDTSFSVTTNGNETNVQWQVDNGTGFVNVNDNVNYSGSGMLTLNILNTPLTFNGNNYRVIVSDNCGKVDTSNVSNLMVNPLIVITAQSGNIDQCLGTDVIYFVSANNAVSYQWQVKSGAGFVNMAGETNDTLSLTSIDLTQDGNDYQCIISNNCNTLTSNTMNLIVSEVAVVISEPEDIVICPEGPGFSFELNFDALNISTYQWQIDTGFGFVNLNDIENFNGSNTEILTVSVPFENIDGANFRLQYTDDCGNGATSSVYNSRISTPDPVNGVSDATFCQREIELIEVDYDGTDYIWNDGSTGRFIEPTESGAYIVNFMQNSSSCMAADTINVIIEDCVAECVVNAPTGFSPDGKGFNNTFKAIYTCELDYFEMLIVNRWGEVIFVSDNVTNAWDGTYKNKPVPIGIYSWYIKYNKVGENNRQSLSGTVTLIR